eukprot:5467085-Pleurochrysis_carterae.AAC.1
MALGRWGRVAASPAAGRRRRQRRSKAARATVPPLPSRRACLVAQRRVRVVVPALVPALVPLLVGTPVLELRVLLVRATPLGLCPPVLRALAHARLCRHAQRRRPWRRVRPCPSAASSTLCAARVGEVALPTLLGQVDVGGRVALDLARQPLGRRQLLRRELLVGQTRRVQLVAVAAARARQLLVDGELVPPTRAFAAAAAKRFELAARLPAEPCRRRLQLARLAHAPAPRHVDLAVRQHLACRTRRRRETSENDE